MYTSSDQQDSSWVIFLAAITILFSLIYSTASTSDKEHRDVSIDIDHKHEMFFVETTFNKGIQNS